jgi:16S rRNA (guanine527-N7)-methyltransferase
MDNLCEHLQTIGVGEPARATELMLGYMRLVLERNKVMNLTAITDEEAFVKNHLLDSIACYGRPEIEKAKSVVDVGTGAGFPGVPLAVCYPDKDFLLIDALGKRTSFIREACATLGIDNVRTLHARAEDAATGAVLRESFDLAVSRAVAHLTVLCEYCLPLVRPGGAFFAYKSESQCDEIEESKKARFLLGAAADVQVWNTNPAASRNASFGETKGDGKGVFTQSGERTQQPDRMDSVPSRHLIIVVSKERPTPATYPRKAGTPAKIPL